jgi:hypothetical protein
VHALTALAEEVAGLNRDSLPRSGASSTSWSSSRERTTKLRKNELQRLMSAITDAV